MGEQHKRVAAACATAAATLGLFGSVRASPRPTSTSAASGADGGPRLLAGATVVIEAAAWAPPPGLDGGPVDSGPPAVPSAEPPEPAIAVVLAAAARRAGGDEDDERSRQTRARLAHALPLVRGQVGGRHDDKLQTGDWRAQPVHLGSTGEGDVWSITAAWDLAQLVYDRDEGHLAEGHLHLAHARQQAAERAAQLWLERLQLVRSRRGRLLSGTAEAEVVFRLVQVTAALDALTGGLYRAALERAEADAVGR